VGSKLRRRELIPQDTPVVADVTSTKLVHDRFGRQLQAEFLVAEGDYRGTTFRTWLSFGKDNETDEEYIPYGGALYAMLAVAEPKIDEILDDEDLSEKKYEQFVKKAANKLVNTRIMGRVGIKSGRDNPEKKTQILQPGSIGPYRDSEEDFDEIPFGDDAKEGKS
jgi:hypothetical protein